MEDAEVPLEKLAEDIEHSVMHPGSVGWISWSALLSAFLAVFAAVAALKSGHMANDAMMDQIQSSDKWAYFQAKSIKASILDSRLQILKALNHPASVEDQKKLEDYANDQKELKTEGEEFSRESQHHFHLHEIFARAVTMFQVAIAITAISVLTRKRRFLAVSGVFGILGLAFLIQGLLG